MFRVGVFVFFFFISAVWQSQTNLPTHFLNFLWDGSGSAQIAVVKSCEGTLFPPNEVVYQDAFDGLIADVQYIYAHNGFEQNIVLRQKPPLPQQFGFDPSTTRVEVWTQFSSDSQPVKTIHVLKKQMNAAKSAVMAEPDLIDEQLDFGDTIFPMGKAFASSDVRPTATTLPLEIRIPDVKENDLAVGKRWNRIGDANILVESLDWADLEPKFKNLSRAAGMKNPNVIPKRSEAMIAAIGAPLSEKGSGIISLASTKYAPDSVIIDYQIPQGTVSSQTFVSGTTYYISGSFTITGSASFQPGCIIKYANNGYITLSGGNFFFPSSGLRCVFTAKDDDLLGEKISGSTGSPVNSANPAIAVYYVSGGYTVQNARFLYCKTGISYAGSASYTYPLNNSFFQNSQTGVSLSLLGGTVGLSGDTQQNVGTAVSPVNGPYTGSMSSDSATSHQIESYVGITKEDLHAVNIPNANPGDPHGCVGPSHVIQMANNGIAIYNKYTGQTLALASLVDFFAIDVNGDGLTDFPVYVPGDPRIIYDVKNGRWIACALDTGSGNIVGAVSNNSNPYGTGGSTWIANNWKQFYVSTYHAGTSTDFPNLGLDDNGIYLTVRFSSGYNGIYTVTRSALYQTNPAKAQGTLVADNINSFRLQPAYNFDALASTDLTWFMTNPADAQHPGLAYLRLQWVNGAAQLIDSSPVSVSGTFFPNPTAASQLPDGTSNETIQLTDQSQSLTSMGVIRDGYLWTCYQAGCDPNGASSGLIDRVGCRWLKYQIRTDTQPFSLTQVDSGVVYDSSTDPFFYYYPALSVNARGDMVIGFSGSKSSQHIGAFYGFRASTDAVGTRVTANTLLGGQDYYNNSHWGDYSSTFMDPTNPGVFWTVQAYGATRAVNNSANWGTWIGIVTPF